MSRPPRRPRTRTLVVVGVCIAVLAGLAVGVNTLRWKGSVTLLANWSGANEQNLRDSVIEPFEDKYRIHVVYQGSSAESQVLAADVESGTPPDVVVMPGPGELADYASQGLPSPGRAGRHQGLRPHLDAGRAGREEHRRPHVLGAGGRRPQEHGVAPRGSPEGAAGRRRRRARLLVPRHGQRRDLRLAGHRLAGGHPAATGGPGRVPAVRERRFLLEGRRHRAGLADLGQAGRRRRRPGRRRRS